MITDPFWERVFDLSTRPMPRWLLVMMGLFGATMVVNGFLFGLAYSEGVGSLRAAVDVLLLVAMATAHLVLVRLVFDNGWVSSDTARAERALLGIAGVLETLADEVDRTGGGRGGDRR